MSLFPSHRKSIRNLISYPVDIMAFVKDNSPPATIILISGDRDFAYLLSTIRWRKYNVVLISNTLMTHESLTAQASVVYDWKSDILKARPPSKLPPLRPRRETLPSVGSPSAPQESDNSPGSDVRAAGPPNKQTTPAIDPLALPSRPSSIATSKKIRPPRKNLPPDAPLTKSKAIPTPPKAEAPTEAAPASFPMTPTSSDRIVADLTNESTVVHLTLRPLIPSFNRFSLRPTQSTRSMKVVSTLLYP